MIPRPVLMAAILLAAILLADRAARAASPPAQAAFAMLQSWRGAWSIQASGKALPIDMTYDTGSKNSIVTEEFGRELSVFSVDGGTVLMTHYCNAGNQPRLRLRLPIVDGVYDFTMTDITGLTDPRAAHVREVVYHVHDPRTMDLAIFWDHAVSSAPESYTLIRRAD